MIRRDRLPLNLDLLNIMMMMLLFLSLRGPLPWRTRPNILASLIMACGMVKENKSGKTSLCMRDIGLTTRPMDEEDSYMAMETFTKANGKMTRLTVEESIQMQINQVIQDSGSKTSKMVMEYKSGSTVLHIKGTS
jgi:hypothetical protein